MYTRFKKTRTNFFRLKWHKSINLLNKLLNNIWPNQVPTGSELKIHFLHVHILHTCGSGFWICVGFLLDQKSKRHPVQRFFKDPDSRLLNTLNMMKKKFMIKIKQSKMYKQNKIKVKFMTWHALLSLFFVDRLRILRFRTGIVLL